MLRKLLESSPPTFNDKPNKIKEEKDVEIKQEPIISEEFYSQNNKRGENVSNSANQRNNAELQDAVDVKPEISDVQSSNELKSALQFTQNVETSDQILQNEGNEQSSTNYNGKLDEIKKEECINIQEEVMFVVVVVDDFSENEEKVGKSANPESDNEIKTELQDVESVEPEKSKDQPAHELKNAFKFIEDSKLYEIKEEIIDIEEDLEIQESFLENKDSDEEVVNSKNLENDDDNNIQLQGAEKSKSESDNIQDVMKERKTRKVRRKKECKVCSKTCVSNDELKLHHATHTGEKIYECTLCSKKCSNKKALYNHTRRHYLGRPHKCSICGHGFPYECHLKEHMVTHSAETPFKCKICENSFKRKATLRCHMTKHTARPIPCPNCDKKFSNLAQMKKHQKTNHFGAKYTCTKCDREYLTEAALKYHNNTNTECITFRYRTHIDKVHGENIVDDKVRSSTGATAVSDIVEEPVSEIEESYSVSKESGEKASNSADLESDNHIKTDLEDSQIVKSERSLDQSDDKSKSAVQFIQEVRRSDRILRNKVGSATNNVPSSPNVNGKLYEKEGEKGSDIKEEPVYEIEDSYSKSEERDEEASNSAYLESDDHNKPEPQDSKIVKSEKSVDQFDDESIYLIQEGETLERILRYKVSSVVTKASCSLNFKGDRYKLREIKGDEGTDIKVEPVFEIERNYSETEDRDKGVVNSANLESDKQKKARLQSVKKDKPQNSNGFQNSIERKFTCKKCSKVFLNKNEYVAHIGKQIHECTLCPKYFKSITGLSYHALSYHTNERAYECDVCGFKFVNKSSLVNHIRTHTGEKYKCKHCPKYYKSKGGVKDHILRNHTDKHSYECNVCGCTFFNKKTFEGHMRTHTGEKPFECKYCGKRFAARASLTDHKTTHTGKQLECPNCDKKFSLPNRLKLHQKEVHLGVKYTCTECGKEFSRKNSLFYHRRTTHMVHYNCEICYKTFSGKKRFISHLRGVHGNHFVGNKLQDIISKGKINESSEERVNSRNLNSDNHSKTELQGAEIENLVIIKEEIDIDIS